MSISTTPSPESRVLTGMLIAMTSTIAGGTIGGVTNAINCAVSPLYFRNIMNWHNVTDIWRAGISQGVFEGLLYGTLFAIVFTPIVIYFSRDDDSLMLAFRSLLAAIVADCACWILGGLLAMTLVIVSPEFYRATFRGVPDNFHEMRCYAWVGGSIWDAEFGGVLAVVVGSMTFAMWSRRQSAKVSA